MEMNSVEALLIEQLKDLYSAENQLLKALPKMARRASDPTLREAFENHNEETRNHVERLQEIGESLGLKLGGKKCKAMEGLIEEGSEVLEMDGEDTVIDAALIAAAQRVEHYEISAYGTARTLAERVGEQQMVDLLQQTLDEEYATDEKLTQICEGDLLVNAPMRAGMMEQGEEEDESDSADFVGESGEYDESEQESGGRSSQRSSRSGGRSGSRSQSRGSSSRSGSSGGSRSSGGGSSRGGASSRGGSRSGSSRSSSSSGGGSSGNRRSSSSRGGSSGGSRSGSSRGGSRSGSRSSSNRSNRSSNSRSSSGSNR